jgi:hypothetical protein
MKIFMSLWMLGWAFPGMAAPVLELQNIYSRGNDDLNEPNYSTANISIKLIVEENPNGRFQMKLKYSATLTTDNPHGINGGDYFLKQRFNDVDPNLSATKLNFTPGPGGGLLGAEVSGAIDLGEISPDEIGPKRGRVAVTLVPNYPEHLRSPVDSMIDWGIYMKEGKPTLGSIALFGQWKGHHRSPDEILRLVSSNFIHAEAWRTGFPVQ